MRSVRSALIALGAACVLVPTFAGVADAQVSDEYTYVFGVECNNTSGEFDVVTIFTSTDEDVLPFENLETEYDIPGESGITGELDDFDLAPEGNEGDVVTVAFSIPGDATFVRFTWEVSEGIGGTEREDLDGGCTAEVTPTTDDSTTTTVPPTTLIVTCKCGPPPEVDPIVATPHYTG